MRDRNYCAALPIKKNKILFRTDQNNYSCNPKYIAEEIIRQKLPYDLVWITRRNVLNIQADFPPEIRLEMMGTDESLEESATARIIIDNTWRKYLLENGIKKRDGQVYIQTWRGSYGIKKFGLEKHNVPSKESAKDARRDIEQMDYFISHSAWETDFYKRTFWNPKILELGHPRNDIFFRTDTEEIRRKVFNKLGIDIDKKLLLYAPTRNSIRPRKCYNMDYNAVLDALGDKFGGEWIMAARMTALANREKFLPESERIINVSDYTDIQELLVAANVCISDYSSCIFDYLHTRKPAFIYASDQASYERGRGLYYPLSQTPFMVATNSKEMINHIQEFDKEKYQKKVDAFLKGKKSIEDGHAAERVVEYIKQIIQNDSLK